jgi:hypothetical protein
VPSTARGVWRDDHADAMESRLPDCFAGCPAVAWLPMHRPGGPLTTPLMRNRMRRHGRWDSPGGGVGPREVDVGYLRGTWQVDQGHQFGWQGCCRAGLAGDAVRHPLEACGYRVPADSAGAVVPRCPRTHGGRDLCPGTVGAHRRLFHGRPRTGPPSPCFRLSGRRRLGSPGPCEFPGRGRAGRAVRW